MGNTFKFNKTYGLLCITIFLIEVLILKTSGFIRHTLGDFLAVMVVYYFVKSFYNITPIRLGIYVLLFSYTIEFLQLIKLVDLVGLSDNRTAVILFGNTFSIGDLVAYTLGVITVVAIDKRTTV